MRIGSKLQSLFDVHNMYVECWLPFRSVPRARPIYNWLRWTCILLIFCWTLFLLAGWIGKYSFEANGWFMFKRYLTNWTWAGQCIFYIIFLVACCDRSGWLLRNVVYKILYWPTRMAIWGVFWMVIPVLRDSPGLVTDNFDSIGAGWTLVAERCFHVITYVFIEQMNWLIRSDLQEMLNLEPARLWLDVLQNILVVHIYVAVYWANNNFDSVYHLNHEYTTWVMVVMFEVIAVLYGGVWNMLLLSPYGQKHGDGMAFDAKTVEELNKQRDEFVLQSLHQKSKEHVY